jgi:hypothetical protein
MPLVSILLRLKQDGEERDKRLQMCSEGAVQFVRAKGFFEHYAKREIYLCAGNPGTCSEHRQEI